MSEPVATLPLAPIRTRSRRPRTTNALLSIISPSVSGVTTWSSYSTGAPPVPPSDPSTMMKSGPVPSSTIAFADGQQLMPGADAELEARGLATGQLPHLGDEADQLARRGENLAAGRADASLTLGDTARVGDLLGDLGPRQNAAECRAWRLG
jgi:hypothetical protein